MTTTAVPTPRTDQPRTTPVRVRVGQVLLTLLLGFCGLFALSAAFVDDPFPPAAVTLISSFGVLAVGFGVVLVWSAPRSRAARVAVWALPLFFVWHVAALGSWIPDAGFAVLAAIGALLTAYAGRGRR